MFTIPAARRCKRSLRGGSRPLCVRERIFFFFNKKRNDERLSDAWIENVSRTRHPGRSAARLGNHTDRRTTILDDRYRSGVVIRVITGLRFIGHFIDGPPSSPTKPNSTWSRSPPVPGRRVESYDTAVVPPCSIGSHFTWLLYVIRYLSHRFRPVVVRGGLGNGPRKFVLKK